MSKAKLTAEQLDELGKISDTADNFAHASKLRVPAHIHVSSLSEGMAELRDRIRALYRAVSGENPWAIQP